MSAAPIYNQVLESDAQRDHLVSHLRRARLTDDNGNKLHITIWRWTPGKTPSQNNLAQAYCGILAHHVGCTHGEMWRDLCTELLGEVEFVNRITGEVYKNYRSSTTIEKTAEMSVFIDGIKRIAQEMFGITLPEADSPQAWLAFRKLKMVSTTKRVQK